jgi:hypothetical protein
MRDVLQTEVVDRGGIETGVGAGVWMDAGVWVGVVAAEAGFCAAGFEATVDFVDVATSDAGFCGVAATVEVATEGVCAEEAGAFTTGECWLMKKTKIVARMTVATAMILLLPIEVIPGKTSWRGEDYCWPFAATICA